MLEILGPALLCTVQIERLRKEGSRLVAEEQEKLEQQIREESSQLYNDGDTGIRLRVRTVFLTGVVTDSSSPSAVRPLSICLRSL